MNNVIFHVIFIVLFAAVMINFVKDVSLRLKMVFKGQKVNIEKDIVKKAQSLLVNVLLQKKLFKRPLRGIFHAFIFYGFLYFGLHTTSQIVAGTVGWWLDNPYLFHLLPIDDRFPFGTWYLTGLDYVSILVLIGLAAFAYRRWIYKARELDRPSGQSALILSLIAILMFATLLSNAALPIMNPEHYMAATSSIAHALSAIYPSVEAATFAQAIFWWVHILAVFVFMIVVPKSKHSHLIFAPFNFWWLREGPKGQLTKMNLEDENITAFGATNIADFGWKNLLDGVSCIECGRCTIVCPANNTGKLLNPKKIMTDIKHALIDKMPAVLAGTEGADTRVLDSYISYDEVWACTTCYACVDQCPVGNNHVDAIIDMRRAFVLSESKFPTELQTTFRNMENNSNPWGVGAHQRADWAKGLDVKIMGKMDKPEDVEYLYWVGCAGSFDERNKKISRALVNVLNHAKVDFAILGEQETCTGDSARRAGNEYLYQTMATGNVELFNNYKVKKVITGCPHCFNTIKNEYPQFGGNYEVIHHSQLITNLIADGKIKVDPTKNSDLGSVTLHDACYLGRYNNEFDAPRSVIENAIGKPSVDIEQSKSNSMCCGAGGAQMWMEEHVGDRVNSTRTDQLLKAKPNTIATNCPFCITMVSDGIKAKPEAGPVKVLDIAEIIESSLVN